MGGIATFAGSEQGGCPQTSPGFYGIEGGPYVRPVGKIHQQQGKKTSLACRIQILSINCTVRICTDRFYRRPGDLPAFFPQNGESKAGRMFTTELIHIIYAPTRRLYY